MLNTHLLKSKRVLNCLKQEDMAKTLSMSPKSYCHKENAMIEFRPSEIQKIIQVLKLTNQDVQEIFFSQELPKV